MKRGEEANGLTGVCLPFRVAGVGYSIMYAARNRCVIEKQRSLCCQLLSERTLHSADPFSQGRLIWFL